MWRGGTPPKIHSDATALQGAPRRLERAAFYTPYAPQVVLADFEGHLPKCGRLWLMDHDIPSDLTHKLPTDPGEEEREGGITQDYIDTLTVRCLPVL